MTSLADYSSVSFLTSCSDFGSSVAALSSAYPWGFSSVFSWTAAVSSKFVAAFVDSSSSALVYSD